MPQVTSCEFGRQYCQNSVEAKGEGWAKCVLCRLAPGNEELSRDYWRPVDKKHYEHPVLWKQKRDRHMQKTIQAHRDRLARDKNKIRVVRRAVRAERTTEQNIIRATKNSGRSMKDGDHKAGSVTLDTKMQSTRSHPVVQLEELAKVREDSIRAGTTFGALVLRNCNGVGVVAMNEADFARYVLPHFMENLSDEPTGI